MWLLRGIQEILELADGGALLIGSAEEGDDVADLAVGGEGRDLEHVGQHELGVAVLGVFFEQLLQDGAGFGALAVGQIQDPGSAVLAGTVPAGVPELPADLEGHGGFPGGLGFDDGQREIALETE